MTTRNGYYHGDNEAKPRRFNWELLIPFLLMPVVWGCIAYVLVIYRHEIERCVRSLGL